MTTRLRHRSQIVIQAASLLLIGALTTGASAQSLAEVARKEAERRQQLTTAGKRYTNDDLPADARSPVPAAPAVAKPEEPERAAASTPEAAAPPPQDRRDESYWRGRATEIRGRVQQIGDLTTALKARVKDLAAQLESGAGPSTGREYEVSLRALVSAQKDAVSMQGEWDRFEARGRSMNASPDWLK
jgi:hypothetical protein